MQTIPSFENLTITSDAIHPTAGDYLLFDKQALDKAVVSLGSFSCGMKNEFAEKKSLFRALCAFDRLVDKLICSQIKFENIRVDAYDRMVHEMVANEGFPLDDSDELTFDVGNGCVLIFNENLPPDVQIVKSWSGLNHFYFIFETREFRKTVCELYKQLQTILKMKEEIESVCLFKHGTPPGLIEQRSCLFVTRMSYIAQEGLIFLAKCEVRVSNSLLEEFVERLISSNYVQESQSGEQVEHDD